MYKKHSINRNFHVLPTKNKTIYQKRFLRICSNILEKHPSTSAVQTSFRYIDNKNNIISMDYDTISSPLSATFIRKEVLDKIKVEDKPFQEKTVKKLKEYGPIIKCNHILCYIKQENMTTETRRTFPNQLFLKKIINNAITKKIIKKIFLGKKANNKVIFRLLSILQKT